jgi:hypothetical protein
MSTDDSGHHDQPADHAEAETDVSRREALGRFARYTAPVMLALLASAQTASASVSCIISHPDSNSLDFSLPDLSKDAGAPESDARFC